LRNLGAITPRTPAHQGLVCDTASDTKIDTAGIYV
jgi:hypothetical protein